MERMMALIEWQTWRPIHSLKGHEEAVSFLAWSPDDTMLLTCSNDNKVRLWDAKVYES